MNLIAQIIGIFAIITWVFSIQRNKRLDILLIQGIANIFFGIQYLLLEAYSAGIISLISSIRCYVFRKNNKFAKSKLSLSLFIGLTILTGIITYNKLLSLIPVFIYSIYTYTSWIEDLRKFRIVFILCAIIWLFYNKYVGAYTACIGNTLEIIGGTIALLKYDVGVKHG